MRKREFVWVFMILLVANFNLSAAVPNPPTELTYHEVGFDEKSGCIIYEVYFTDNAINEEGFEVVVQRDNDAPEFVDLPANVNHDMIADNNRCVYTRLAGEPGEKLAIVARARNSEGFSRVSNTCEILLPLKPVSGLIKRGKLWEWDKYSEVKYYFIRNLSSQMMIACISSESFESSDSVAVIAFTKDNCSLATPYRALSLVSAVEKKNVLPETFGLEQNYPNPFNPSTTIPFRLDCPAKINLAVYDVFGREVAILDEGFKSAGSHSVKWNATCPSGVYFIVLRAGSFSQTRKMILEK